MRRQQHSEVAGKADFSIIRYAQCWEDADVLLEALDVQPGDTCLSIASAGDNTLSLLSKGPSKVIAIDLSPAQVACLEIRMAAYRALSYSEFVELIGARASDRRLDLYRRVRIGLSADARAIWDARPAAIEAGVGTAGKFETYLRTFRRRILPLIHPRRRREALLVQRDRAGRAAFYEDQWDNLRWRWLVTLFCSRAVSARLGRDASFYRYVEGKVGQRVLSRAKFALTELDPCKNPYLQWIIFGEYRGALPHALRFENFAAIRDNLDRLELRTGSLESWLAESPTGSIDRFNLSDVFEYMSQDSTDQILAQVARTGRSGGRAAYWNMYVPRKSSEAMRGKLLPLTSLAQRLHRVDKAFFYNAFVVEKIV